MTCSDGRLCFSKMCEEEIGIIMYRELLMRKMIEIMV